MYVCLCKAVTDTQVVEAVDQGAVRLSEVMEKSGLGTGCGRCQTIAQQLIDQRLAESLSFAAA
jgi:bacterioferritin-associated ferredoxin